MITIPYFTALTTYFSYGLLFAFGQFRDFFRKIFDRLSHSHSSLQVLPSLISAFERTFDPCCEIIGFVCYGRAMLLFVWGLRISTSGGCIRGLRIALTDQYQALPMLGLMWWSVSPRTITKLCTPSYLEKVLKEQIAEGQPRTHRPWKKIIVVVEGIYSMEGELCKLPEIVSISKKYKAYIYLDEAHSIGAVGKTGRGVCELLGVDTADVDIMMGTFSKSFGSCGGYIAGSKELIDYLKYTCPAHLYATSISPPAAQQIISSIKVILGEDGSSRGAQKLAKIRENSNFFRSELQKMGFEVLGDNDSPVMPIMLYNPAKIPAFSRECLKRNVAVVGVAFPATPLLLGRVRICISATHSKEDLVKALEVISSVGDLVGIKYFPAEPKKQPLEGDRIKLE